MRILKQMEAKLDEDADSETDGSESQMKMRILRQMDTKFR